VREAIKLHDGEFDPVESAEVVLSGPDSPARRVGVSVQVITEGETRMGALVRFTDLESRERISTQLQVSERLLNSRISLKRGPRSEESLELDADMA